MQTPDIDIHEFVLLELRHTFITIYYIKKCCQNTMAHIAFIIFVIARR